MNSLFAIGVVGVIVAGIVLCVRYDQKGKTRRREMEHVERMRALELGKPLEDAAVARYEALGAVGVAAPIVSLSSAVLGSCVALAFGDPAAQLTAFAVSWVAAAVVCVPVLPVVAARLRETPPGPAAGPDADNPAESDE